MARNKNMKAATLLACLLLAGCDGSGGLSAAEAEAAAKERVRQSLHLSEDTTLFSKVFVGEPIEGDTVLCGTVEGRREDGTRITPRRFIAATDPARWVKFEPVIGLELPSRPDKFIEWHSACLGEEEVR